MGKIKHTHSGTQENKNRHRWQKWKIKVSPLGDQAKGTALYTHSSTTFLTTKQPEQLAAPLELGEGKRSC